MGFEPLTSCFASPLANPLAAHPLCRSYNEVVRASVIGSDTVLTDATGNAFSVKMIRQELPVPGVVTRYRLSTS